MTAIFPTHFGTAARRALGMAALVFVSLAIKPVSGATWDFLGPEGGAMASIAASQASGGNLYTVTGQNQQALFSSNDSGLRWTARALPNCTVATSPWLPQVRGDGHVFVHCGGSIVRSRDGGATWDSFTNPPVDGILAFDLSDSKRAVVFYCIFFGGSCNSNPNAYAVTANDGQTWTQYFPAAGAVVPRLIAFDAVQPGRLLGVTTSITGASSSSTYHTTLYESRDYGTHWSTVAAVLPAHGDELPCYYERQISIDPAGRIFVNHDCGLFRSTDGGATWQKLSGFPGDRSSPIVFGAAGRALASSGGTAFYSTMLYESLDSGTTWQALPAPPKSFADFAVDAAGQAWIATIDGIFALASSSGSWTPRFSGLTARPVSAVVPTAGPAVVLTTIDGSFFAPRNVQSRDGGLTWAPYTVGGQAANQLAPNITRPSSIMALTSESTHQLHVSDDAGLTWQLASGNPMPAAGQLATDLVPTGLQPGLVYGLHESCVNVFGVCSWPRQGVTKSLDGGATWTNVDTGLSAQLNRLAVSAGDPNTAVAYARASVSSFITRDAALHWQPISLGFSVDRIVADSRDAARWYATDVAGQLWTSANYGLGWTMIARPPIASSSFDLLVDRADTRILYAIGSAGEVGASDDRGMSWQLLLDPSAVLALAAGSAMLAPGTPATIYAGSNLGVLRLAIPQLSPGESIPTLDPRALALLMLILTLAAALVRSRLRDRS